MNIDVVIVPLKVLPGPRSRADVGTNFPFGIVRPCHIRNLVVEKRDTWRSRVRGRCIFVVRVFEVIGPGQC